MKRLSIYVAALVLTAVAAVPAGAQDAAATISPRLVRALADEAGAGRQADGTLAVWVFLNDRGLADADLAGALARAQADLGDRARARRAKVLQPGARLVDARDLPLRAEYLDAVAATGVNLRRQSRWFNAVSVDATADQIAALAELAPVARLDLVARFIRPEPTISPDDLARAEAIREQAENAAAGRWTLDYGGTTAGLEQINVPPVHEMGLSGGGVLIALLDAGFKRTHPALLHVDVINQWDFVNDDPIVENEPGDPQYQDRHGTHVLSSIMGFQNGSLVGPAYGASVILCKTEDISSETPIEEDNWVAAAEWVETLGADIISTSLGYFYWYEFSDMDGNTALITNAADMAVERGMCVFTSAGNERNSDWGHMTAPADGDSVVAMGAVDLAGQIASFSSPGPTYDGRIKPDVSAQGVGNFVVSYYDDTNFQTVNGTSFAAPLVAGVAALLLERVPSLTPMEIRDALRETADRAGAPDNDYGWGLIDALAAASYWGPAIEHTPLNDTEDLVGPYLVSATITDRNPLDPGGLYVFWRVDGGPWSPVAMAAAGGDVYTAAIPGQPGGGLVEYYLEASDTIGITVTLPHGAPAGSYAFIVGTDLEAPSLRHGPATDQTLTSWPPALWAQASDNQAVGTVSLAYTLNGGPEQGPFPFSLTDDTWALDFPIAAGSLREGDVLFYSVTAADVAAVPNTTTSGPHEVRVTDAVARVLIIDDSVFNEPQEAVARNIGDRDIGDMVTWLTDAGYDVGVIDPGQVDGAAVQGWDVLFLYCSNNQLPVGEPLLRETLIAWVAAGGRVLIEGGAVGEVSFSGFGYPDFAAEVLHCAEWWGDFFGPLQPQAGYEDNYLLIRPNLLPATFQPDFSDNPYDFSGSDTMLPTTDAVPVLRSIYTARAGGAVIHDDDTGPEAGQIAYLTFDLNYLDPLIARPLVENAVAYLTSRQAPGNASVAGTVQLIDAPDNAGVTVTCGGETAVTGPDGQYLILGLHGSTYTVTATKEGYGPASRQVVLGANEAATDIDLVLLPVIEVQTQATPELAIPDNNTDGVVSEITITEVGLLNNITVDIDVSHPSIGQLVITLTSPLGTEVVLHNRTGGIVDDLVGNWPATLTVDGPGALSDLVGEDVEGVWTLRVADHAFGAFGMFHAWGLNLLVAPENILAAPDGVPAATRLVGNAPNPFNPQTTLLFELRRPGSVQLDVFDLRGRHVRSLVGGELPAGRHAIHWDGRDAGGRELASGVYVARLQADGVQQHHKLALVR